MHLPNIKEASESDAGAWEFAALRTDLTREPFDAGRERMRR